MSGNYTDRPRLVTRGPWSVAYTLYMVTGTYMKLDSFFAVCAMLRLHFAFADPRVCAVEICVCLRGDSAALTPSPTIF